MTKGRRWKGLGLQILALQYCSLTCLVRTCLQPVTAVVVNPCCSRPSRPYEASHRGSSYLTGLTLKSLPPPSHRMAPSCPCWTATVGRHIPFVLGAPGDEFDPSAPHYRLWLASHRGRGFRCYRPATCHLTYPMPCATLASSPHWSGHSLMLTSILANHPAIKGLMLIVMLTISAIFALAARVWWLLGRFTCLACGVAYSYAKSDSTIPSMFCCSACEDFTPQAEDDGA